MAISKQDRTTAITIAVVLIVCTISLVALISFLWQLLSPTFRQAQIELDELLFKVRSDYNFPIPIPPAETN
jgi:uncharacterized membrane protein